jgi:Flp pilus assembly protein TadG
MEEVTVNRQAKDWTRLPKLLLRASGRAVGRLAARLDPGDEHGNGLVEIALVMPVLVLILVGAGEMGRLVYYAIEVSNAAHAGAAYAAQSHATASNTSNIALAAANDAANVASLATTSSISCSCSNGTAITCANAATTCVSPGRILEFVQVNTSATVNPMFNYPGISSNFNLTGKTTMKVQQ